jgi:ADP-heptose:LPS heptosyltransferase
MALALVHLAAGIGNIILATPLLQALERLHIHTHLLLDADYPGVAELFDGWSAVEEVVTGPANDRISSPSYTYLIPAVPPFYWSRFASAYGRDNRSLPRPHASLFFSNEQKFYMNFASRLGFHEDTDPLPFLPVSPVEQDDTPVSATTVVLAPGCKTGEMANKRWPYFAELAGMFDDVAVVGTADDLYHCDSPFRFPEHVKNYAGKLSLRDTAQFLASAGIVVGNDSGLSHLAAAVGTPSLMLFGPTPHNELGTLAPHVQVLRSGLVCEPCWLGQRFHACEGRIDCLRQITAAEVAERIRLRYKGGVRLQ